MAARRGLVLGGDGLVQQLQAGDTLGCNAFFTGTAALPALALLGSATSTVTVAPVAPGDILAAGEVVTVTPATALPAGLNISYAIVSAPNTVVIGFTAAIAITAASMSWRVAAHR